MAYTSHGIHIPGTGLEGATARVARCKGMLGCRPCQEEAAGTRVIPPIISLEFDLIHTAYECLARAGVDPRKAHEAVKDMQRHGIFIRERNNPQ